MVKMTIPENDLSFVLCCLFINGEDFAVLINFYRASFLSFGEYLLAILRLKDEG
jgi:hypothetical protein